MSAACPCSDPCEGAGREHVTARLRHRRYTRRWSLRCDVGIGQLNSVRLLLPYTNSSRVYCRGSMSRRDTSTAAFASRSPVYRDRGTSSTVPAASKSPMAHKRSVSLPSQDVPERCARRERASEGHVASSVIVRTVQTTSRWACPCWWRARSITRRSRSESHQAWDVSGTESRSTFPSTWPSTG